MIPKTHCTNQHLLIDADSIIYKAGCANEDRFYRIEDPEGYVVHTCQYKAEADAFVDSENLNIVADKDVGPVAHSLSNAKRVVEQILDNLQHTEYQLFIQGEGNFRKDLYPEYKMNRAEFSRPVHEHDIKDYLVRRWGAQRVNGEEADDTVSWLQCSDLDKYCIVGIDKDLMSTPGAHWNPDKQEYLYLTQEQADWNFYTQLLTGDASDNIPGLPGVGPKKARKILEGSEDYIQTIREEFLERGYNEDYLVLMGRLVWLRREPNQIWTPETMLG